MLCIIIIGVMQMNSELDKIKSTITISLGTKNRLRKIKGSKSYEDYINYLLRQRKQINYGDNVVELQKFKRKKGIFSDGEYKILFSYNEHNSSENFVFDIKVDTVRKNGRKTSYSVYIKDRTKNPDLEYIDRAKAYFKLLQVAIQQEIEPTFKHTATFADYYAWEKEFEVLNLSKKSFDMDVMDRLEDYQNWKEKLR